jgi:hypothetical protein
MMIEDPIHEANHTGIAVFCGALALFLCAVYAVSRIGFTAAPPSHLAGAFSAAIFCLVVPLLLGRLAARRRGGAPAAWWESGGALSLAALLFVYLLALASRLAGLSLLIVLEAAAPFLLAYLARRAVKTWRRPSAPAILAQCVLAAWVAFVVWGSSFLTPVFLEKLAAGKGHLDTLFHVSLSGMIGTYGRPTTGLDGLTFTPYHFGSHYLFAQLSWLFGFRVVEVYNLVYPVVFVPLMLNALLGFASEARARRGINEPLGGVFWWALAFVLIGVLPPAARSAMAMGWNENFLSESYLVSTTLFFWTASMGISFQGAHADALAGREGRRLGAAGLAFLYAVLPIAMAMIGFAKVSNVYFLMIIVVYVTLRRRLYRNPHVVASIVLCAAACAVVFLFAFPADRSMVRPLAFLRTYVAAGWWPLYLVVFWGLPFVYLGLRVSQQGARSLAEARSAFGGAALLDAEALIVVALAGAAPGLVFLIGGGSAVFFAGFQRWLALACILGAIEQSRVTTLLRPREGARRRTGGRGLRQAGAVAATVLLVLGACVNLANRAVAFVGSNLRVRGEIVRQRDPSFDLQNALKAALAPPRPAQLRTLAATLASPSIQRDLAACRERRAIDTLLGLGALPPAEKRASVLYIPQTNRAYWGLNQQPGYTSVFWSKTTAFLAPALTGMAMIGGVPPVIPERLGAGELQRAGLDPAALEALRPLYDAQPDGAMLLKRPADPGAVSRAREALAPRYASLFSSYGYESYPPQALAAYAGPDGLAAAAASARAQGFHELIVLDDVGGALEWKRIAL